MSKELQKDTDFKKHENQEKNDAEALVKMFGENQATLSKLVEAVNIEAKINLDPIAQTKIKALRGNVLVEDLKSQDLKIKLISEVLHQICSPKKLPKT